MDRDMDGRLSRLGLVDRPKLKELLEEALDDSDEHSGALDPDAAEETRARNEMLRKVLDFLLT